MKHTITLVKKEYLNKEVIKLSFNKHGLEWKSGQFGMFLLPISSDEIIRRAYSFSSCLKNKYLEIIVKRVRNGVGTGYLFDNFEENDTVETMLPFGHMTLQNNTQENIFVGVGIGITPLLGMIRELAFQGFPNKTTLYYGARHKADLIEQNELRKYEKEYNNFHYIVSLSRDEKTSNTLSGRILQHITEQDFSKHNMYICGSPEASQDIKDLLLSRKAVDTSIFKEAF
ncbi:hypothetical protein COB57_01000 [Candidatus Peregrinibacteria bacterium]|nr:MAG: hypothetical protein COB57_01000 [Candidatus Peregrinibacteria bacterium]